MLFQVGAFSVGQRVNPVRLGAPFVSVAARHREPVELGAAGSEKNRRRQHDSPAGRLERPNVLHAAFALRPLAEYHGSLVILQTSGEYLAGTAALAIHQTDQGKAARGAVHFRAPGVTFSLAIRKAQNLPVFFNEKLG